MLRLNQRQRSALSETLRELANLVAGAFVLGQFVGNVQFSWSLLLVGWTGWTVLVIVSLALPGEDDNGKRSVDG